MQSGCPMQIFAMAHAITSAQLRVAAGRTRERPQLLKQSLTCELNLILRIGFRYRICRAASEGLARKAYAGTGPNENNLIVLVRAAPRKGTNP